MSVCVQVIKCGGQALDLGKQAIVDVQQLVQSIKSCASADDQLVCSCQVGCITFIRKPLLLKGKVFCLVAS